MLMRMKNSLDQTKPKKRHTKVELPLKPETNKHNPAQHGRSEQAARTFSVASTLMSGVMAISISQMMGAPLKFLDPKTFRAYMAWTKENFAILMISITEWWAPTVIRVSGDESMKGQLYQMKDGSLRCNFPHRIVLMANHQLYTDWLYMWWIAYTNNMHGHIYIILKESLKQVPIIGWGMQYFNFIFLSRKWENDKCTFEHELGRLKNNDPAWLIIFPEGTNLSQVTRENSAAWSRKTGITDMKHQLLPRTTGLQFSLKELEASTNWLYDATIAYEGVAKGGYGQDIFTLKSSFLEGRPPKSVNIFWRRFRIADVPYNNKESFDRWLMNRWREKDYLLEYFDRFGTFPAGDALRALTNPEGWKTAKTIVTEVKGGGWGEFLGIFDPVTTVADAATAVNAMASLGLDQSIRSLSLPTLFEMIHPRSTDDKLEGSKLTPGDSPLPVLKSKQSTVPSINGKNPSLVSSQNLQQKSNIPKPTVRCRPVKQRAAQRLSETSNPQYRPNSTVSINNSISVKTQNASTPKAEFKIGMSAKSSPLKKGTKPGSHLSQSATQGQTTVGQGERATGSSTLLKSQSGKKTGKSQIKPLINNR